MPRRRPARRRRRCRRAGVRLGLPASRRDSGLARLLDNGHVSSIKNVFDEGPEEARTLSMFAAGGAGRGRQEAIVATARRAEGEQRHDAGAARRARGAHERRRVRVRAARQRGVRPAPAPEGGADPLASRQWGHGAIRLGHARAAAGFKNATNITIAVVDSGIDTNHPDLAARDRRVQEFSAAARTRTSSGTARTSPASSPPPPATAWESRASAAERSSR